jgi:hypothetical protein
VAAAISRNYPAPEPSLYVLFEMSIVSLAFYLAPLEPVIIKACRSLARTMNQGDHAPLHRVQKTEVCWTSADCLRNVMFSPCLQFQHPVPPFKVQL